MIHEYNPPCFEQAGNLRQQVRATGLDPNYWYAVEEENRIKKEEVIEVIFWKKSIALYRAADGSLYALENRCAHRQIKLSLGDVQGCNLVCPYHGWAFDQNGRRANAPQHVALRNPLLKPSIRAYPVKVRYGLVWLFPGDPQLAEQRKIPDIPELEGTDQWACSPLTFTWQAHHSMVIDNVSDFTHAYLHRKYRPFNEALPTQCEIIGDSVHLSYETPIGRSNIAGRFVDHKRIDTNHMDLCYEYPYQWSNMNDKFKHWLFVLPINERTTRVFFLFYFKSLNFPMLPIRIPNFAMTAIMKLSNRLHIIPLLMQDQFAVEAEQLAYEAHWDAPPIEFNPAVRYFQKVTVRKWEEHLARGNGEYHDTRHRTRSAE